MVLTRFFERRFHCCCCLVAMSNSLEPHGLLAPLSQARILEWLTISFSGLNRDPQYSTWILYDSATWESPCCWLPTVKVCVIRAFSYEVPVCQSLHPDCGFSDSLALLSFHGELSVSLSLSPEVQELCESFPQITSLDFFYSNSWCHIKHGSRETACLRDLVSPWDMSGAQ